MSKKFALFFLITAALLSACISTSSEPPIVSTLLVASPVPITVPAEFDLADGEALFAANCAPCHGETGGGDGPVAPSFTCPMPILRDNHPQDSLSDWLKIVREGQQRSDGCIMPPWKNTLDSQQLWNVAAYANSLRYDFSQAEHGQALLESARNAAESDEFTDSTWQAENSDAAILAAITDNTLSGYDFDAALTPDDQQGVLAYIRSLIFTTPTIALPAPLTTPTAQPDETFTLTGQVINGTAGGEVPAALNVRLRIAGLDAEGNPQEVFSQEAITDSENRFRFENVPVVARTLAVVETDYRGVRQFGPQIFVEPTDQDITFTIYETTSESVDLVYAYVEILVDAITTENTSQIFQNFEVSNPSDWIYTGDSLGRTVALPLPAGARNIEVQALGSSPNRFESIEDNGALVYYDTQPLFPNALTRFTFAYNVAYSGQMALSHTFPYTTEELRVYISDTRGLDLESEQLTPLEAVDVQGMRYEGFGVINFPAGEALNYRVFDGAHASINLTQPEAVPEASFISENAGLILGLGVLLLVAGGMFMAYELQKRRLMIQEAAFQIPATQEELIAAIATLDNDYEGGHLAESHYHQRRDALKSALRRLIR